MVLDECILVDIELERWLESVPKLNDKEENDSESSCDSIRALSETMVTSIVSLSSAIDKSNAPDCEADNLRSTRKDSRGFIVATTAFSFACF